MYSFLNGDHGRQVDTIATHSFTYCDKLSISRAAKKAGAVGIFDHDLFIFSNINATRKSSFIKVVDISNLNIVLFSTYLVSLQPVAYILKLLCILAIGIYGMSLVYKVFWVST